jgi:hypothetical protein
VFSSSIRSAPGIYRRREAISAGPAGHTTRVGDTPTFQRAFCDSIASAKSQVVYGDDANSIQQTPGDLYGDCHLAYHHIAAVRGGVSFWVPGNFGSMAAVPPTPGWSFAEYYYHSSVGAAGKVPDARAIRIGTFTGIENVTVNGSVHSPTDLLYVAPSYAFATPVLGGQAAKKTGHEFSAVTGLTYNFINPAIEYQNGIDWHFDWAASQFLSEHLQVGLASYFYNQITGDSGRATRSVPSCPASSELVRRYCFFSQFQGCRDLSILSSTKNSMPKIVPMAGTPG